MIWDIILGIPVSMIYGVQNTFDNTYLWGFSIGSVIFGNVQQLPNLFGVSLDDLFSRGMSFMPLIFHFFPPLALALGVTLFILTFEIVIRIARMIPVIGKFFPQG